MFFCAEHGEFFYDGPDVPHCPGCILPWVADASPFRQGVDFEVLEHDEVTT